MKLVTIAWLTIVWTALWGSPTPANLAGGLVTALVVVRLFPASSVTRASPVFRPLAIVYFAGWFVVKLVEANLVMVREVLTPTDYSNPGVVAVPISRCSSAVATLIANAISLTPGTLTLDVRGEPKVLYIHVMHLDDPEEVRRRVHRLEALAIRAFGSGHLDDTPTAEAS
jgi:multicomponent Na+:H+ antiporter subunit E